MALISAVTARDYIRVADMVAAEIAEGTVRAGDRLLPQRAFAHRHGIAASTASRVYAELSRRGLVAGEVGRGTFVRAAPPLADPPLVEPTAAPVDLQLIFPMLPQYEAVLAHNLAKLAKAPDFARALRPVGAAATPSARQAAAAFLARPGWEPDPGCILFAGNGRQAIAAALAGLAGPGRRIAVERLTYPVVKGIATRLGLTLVPIDMDGQGLIPDALAAAHRATPLAAVYLQPCLHNPLGTTMGDGRRAALAAVLRETGLDDGKDSCCGFTQALLHPGVMAAVGVAVRRAAAGVAC